MYYLGQKENSCEQSYTSSIAVISVKVYVEQESYPGIMRLKLANKSVPHLTLRGIAA